MTRKPWLQRFGTSLSQIANVTLLNGDEDESISSRAWKAKIAGRACGAFAVSIIDSIFGAGHCRRAVEWDEGKA